jgi:hypothetical protein
MRDDDDYRKAADAVVEAARNLDKASELYDEAYEFVQDKLRQRMKAGEQLSEALKRLKELS